MEDERYKFICISPNPTLGINPVPDICLETNTTLNSAVDKCGVSWLGGSAMT